MESEDKSGERPEGLVAPEQAGTVDIAWFLCFIVVALGSSWGGVGHKQMIRLRFDTMIMG